VSATPLKKSIQAVATRSLRLKANVTLVTKAIPVVKKRFVDWRQLSKPLLMPMLTVKRKKITTMIMIALAQVTNTIEKLKFPEWIYL
jgi:hypothetical protein